jgi:hypothetical protein
MLFSKGVAQIQKLGFTEDLSPGMAGIILDSRIILVENKLFVLKCYMYMYLQNCLDH